MLTNGRHFQVGDASQRPVNGRSDIHDRWLGPPARWMLGKRTAVAPILALDQFDAVNQRFDAEIEPVESAVRVSNIPGGYRLPHAHLAVEWTRSSGQRLSSGSTVSPAVLLRYDGGADRCQHPLHRLRPPVDALSAVPSTWMPLPGQSAP